MAARSAQPAQRRPTPAPPPGSPRPPEAVFEAARLLARAAAFKHVRAMYGIQEP